MCGEALLRQIAAGRSHCRLLLAGGFLRARVVPLRRLIGDDEVEAFPFRWEVDPTRLLVVLLAFDPRLDLLTSALLPNSPLCNTNRFQPKEPADLFSPLSRPQIAEKGELLLPGEKGRHEGGVGKAGKLPGYV